MNSEELKRQLKEAQEKAKQATYTRIEEGNEWGRAEQERQEAVNALDKVEKKIEDKESKLALMLELAVKNELSQDSARIEVLENKLESLKLMLEAKKDFDDSAIQSKLEELEGKVQYLAWDSGSKDKKIQDLIKQNEELKKQLEKKGFKAFLKNLFRK